MSLFTDLDIPLQKTDKVVAVSVSNVYHNPSVSIMTPNKILLFNELGEKHDYELSRNISPSYTCWHPLLPQIAIGWKNGTVTLWDEEKKMAKEETNVHKDQITIITFSPTGNRMVTADRKGLVAVWRGINCISTYKKEGVITHCIFADLTLQSSVKTGNLFFFGGSSGIVCLADDAKHCSDVCKVGGSIKCLLFYQKENSVIIITSTLLLVQFRISSNDKSGPDKKVKLTISGDPEKLRSIWIGGQLLSTVSSENMIRMWHLEEDENYVLTLLEMQTDDGSNLLNDKICCSIYENRGKVLVAGTQQGNLIFWKNQSVKSDSPNCAELWKTMPYIPFEQTIHHLSVGKNNGLISVWFGNEVALIQETIIKGKLSKNLKLLQTSSDRVSIYLETDITKQMFLYDSKEATIKNLDCYDMHMLIQTNKKIEIHEVIGNLKGAETKLIGSFEEKCTKIALYKESVLLVQQYSLSVANFKGVIKQKLTFSESEGKIQNSDTMGSFMVVWTSENYIRIFDMSRREVKQVGISRRFEDSTGALGNIKTCTINAEGQKVVIVATPIKKKNGELTPANRIYIYDVEMDNFLHYDLGEDCAPIDAYFDYNDKRFFGVLTNNIKTSKTETKNVDHQQVIDFKDKDNQEEGDEEDDDQGNLKLFTFFVTSQNGIKNQDCYTLEPDLEGVFAIRIPTIYYIQRNNTNDPSNNYKIHEQQMNDFQGLPKDLDQTTREAIMNFSFYLSTGNLDEAYKSVKSIQKPQVWEKMAAMSVKTKRIDVAEICLGNMRFARGAKAIREAKKEPELEAQLAMVAIQLKMKDQAVKLYEESKRYDLLNKMYQADGEWDKAIDISQKHDRINYKNTHFKRAQFYEVSKNFDEAINHYELSDTYRKEVPRMLIEAGEIEMLEEYIEEKQDTELFKFWAQYLESFNRFDKAMQFYKRADDNASIVRILCHKKDYNSAKRICQETNDPASCYYLAKQLEIQGAIPDAIQYYKQSQYYTQASKLARQQGMDQEVMVIALQAPAQVKLLSAAYFEEKKFIDKAFDLYKKGKNYTKAKEIAQKHLGAAEVQEIDRLIGQQASKVALGQGQQMDSGDLPPSQAIPLLIRQKKFDNALQLAISNNIPITDDLQKQILSDELPESKKRQMQEQIAEHLKIQGNFALASQIYIKLGDKESAMKCLINLGAVDKVIKFAQHARQDQIYILAANFLQTTDWPTNPEMMKNIISFYNKAKAYDNLSGFFDACSQVEIDEYRDYDKACAALKEALKHANKSVSPQKDQKIQQIQQKILLIERFIQARNAVQQNPQDMIQQFEALLQTSNIEVAIRTGDIYAHIIEYFHQVRNMDSALQYVQKMQNSKIQVAPYLDSGILQDIYNATGYNPNQQQPQRMQSNMNNNNNNNQDDGDEGFQEEELVEEEDFQ